jgi:fructokinase
MIVCCGEALIDMVPDGERTEAFLARPGGCPFTTAIAAARLGARTLFLGRIGMDFFGESLAERLRASGVDTSLVARRDQPTTLAFVKRSPDGDARYAFYSIGAADRSLDPSDLPASLGPDARFLAVGSISILQEPLASTVEALIERESGRTLVSLDPNVRPSMVLDREAYLARLLRWASMSAIVKASSEDLEWLFPETASGDRASRFLRAGADLVVETRGRAGAIARTRRIEVEAPAFEVRVVDTIGAGDTFRAALLVMLDEAGIATRQALSSCGEAFLRDALAFSQAAAAIDCQRMGAKPPSLGEVRKFLAERTAP